MSSATPPDLKVLCRKLSSLSPTQLPHLLPSLINHVLRCKAVLSAPKGQKLGDTSSETAHLVHKLKTSVSTLLNGRAKEGRFAAVGLIKAMVDVGGWETFRSSQPWVQGLQAILQKADPFATKELAVIALTRIYVLVHSYQTLVREIATPTIPAFVTACLQILKGSVSLPHHVAETICESLSTLVPLYQPTFRPFSSKIRDAVKAYLVPTETDTLRIPQTLRHASRILVTSLHQVVAKAGGSEEWTKHIDSLIKEFHLTADQVFRAVQESWPPKSHVDLSGEARGCNDADATFPAWSGIQAGSQRLIGLTEYLSDCLQYPTQTAVTIPVTALMDLVSRVSSIARHRNQTWDQGLELNAAIGREEKDELWSVLPDVHIAVLQLLRTTVKRLDREAIPLSSEILDYLNRIICSHFGVPKVREASYELLSTVLPLSGSTLSKPIVDKLSDTVKACCRDLLEHFHFMKDESEVNTTSKTESKKSNDVTANADLFLKTNAVATFAPSGASSKHGRPPAATQLLIDTLSFVPQRFLKPSLRSLLDKTAIVSQSQEAMIASVLNPYKDQRGRMYPSILPHLTRQFPQSQSVEVLRTNLRTNAAQDNEATAGEIEAEVDSDQGGEDVTGDHGAEHVDSTKQQPDDGETPNSFMPPGLPAPSKMDIDVPLQPNPFEVRLNRDPPTTGIVTIPDAAGSLAKRKVRIEDDIAMNGKRQELVKPAASATIAPTTANKEVQDKQIDSDNDDDESIHLTMDLDDIEGDSDDDGT